MKQQKIVITGALGYVGFELCKLYSGEARFKEIVVADTKFLSDHIKQFSDWGFKFAQVSILDKQKIQALVQDADLVYHLAGITDVAYTKNESNEAKDKLLTDTAIEGTNNILSGLSGTAKLIFPSTHVVYEGFADTTFNITEDVAPTPVLAYAKSKVQNERDIAASGKQYVILRLASVYGYSGDTMRVNIMPNLFSKMAAANVPIKLFSGGVQYKSLVHVIDVARCLKFMGESEIKNDLFHLSNENKTVAEVAAICKKHQPEITITSTTDEIPNLGTTLSNAKLLKTGFKLRYNLDDAIKEMISNWTPKNRPESLEFIIEGGKPYLDARGKILNYELTEPINLIGYIESKAGAVRANHYHPIQEQKCLLIKGQYISVIKDLAEPNALLQTRLIQAGEVAVIQPNVAHAMVFLQDSIFLNLVRGEREHENFGITHTLPYKLVDDDFRTGLLEHYAAKCRCCLSTKHLKPVISLGLSPLANNLLEATDARNELYPLELVYCDHCHNCQLSYIVPAGKMFDNYLYVSSTTKSFREHFKLAADKYIADFNLNQESVIVDIGSNDGIALRPFKEQGMKVVGVEPAKNIAEMANAQDIHTINDYFTAETAKRILKDHGAVDLVTASNVFAHADGLESIAHAVFSMLKPNGCFVVEVQYLLNTINDLTFDNIYHEHVNYWSVTSLKHFFDRVGYKVVKIEWINTHGGSIRVFVKNKGSTADKSVEEFLGKEEGFGLKQYSTYQAFAKRIEQVKANVRRNIAQLKHQGLSIAGYGSPAKATTSLNYFNVTTKEIDYIVEDNKLKHNKVLPGVMIPIYPKDRIKDKLPDVIVVMAWNFMEEIKKNNQDLIDKGVKFISIKDLQKA